MEIALIIYLLFMATLMFKFCVTARDMWGQVGSLWLALTILLPAIYLIAV